MYAPQFSHGNALQFVSQFPQQQHIHRSFLLIIFGLIQALISGSLIGLCAWVIATDYELTVSYFAITCGLVHTILGTVAVIAGKDTRNNRPCLILCLILGIVGTTIFVTSTLASDAIEYTSDIMTCSNCQYQTTDNPCPLRCQLDEIDMIYVPILVLVILESILGVTISSISWCNLSSCCGCFYTGSNPTQPPYQINPPPSYVPFDNVQTPINYAVSYSNDNDK